MANSYFKFKQFIVHQDKAAMKVGTDGVLLGAWSDVTCDREVLDVGTGTGLITLMLAQRNQSLQVTAIDVDEGAVQQAQHNFSLSNWTERLGVEKCALQNFDKEDSFDHVICNPPYFDRAYKSDDHSRTLARHTDTLSFDELVAHAFRVTHTKARLSLVLPFDVEEQILMAASRVGWFPARILYVRPTPKKALVRILIEFSKSKTATLTTEELIIEDKGRHGYSDKYVALTKDFYLAM